MTYETKADAVVTAAETPEDVRAELAALRAEMKQDFDSLSRRVVQSPPMAASAGRGATGRSGFADGYLRKGIETGFELKRLSVGIGSEGGLAIPLEIDQRIEATLKQISPIRAVANVVKVGSANFRRLIAAGGVSSGWVAEAGARPETSTPVFTEVTLPMGELYANPAATQAMLDDALFDVEGWLAGEIATEFARAEGVAFVAGTGTAQPKGFLTYPVALTADAARPVGTLQYVASGAAGAFVGTNPQDRLVDLVHALRAPYRQGAVWVMNSNTISTVRKFKDTTGDFVWKPGLMDGQSSTLLGYPVVEVDAMPDIGANSLSIGFGQFQSAYSIAERGETAVLRDPYSSKPFVQFYATRRVGGALVNSEALKLMRFSAT
ncbi:MAG: phage major capsid protein [Sandaracinobacteroides sp.]